MPLPPEALEPPPYPSAEPRAQRHPQTHPRRRVLRFQDAPGLRHGGDCWNLLKTGFLHTHQCALNEELELTNDSISCESLHTTRLSDLGVVKRGLLRRSCLAFRSDQTIHHLRASRILSNGQRSLFLDVFPHRSAVNRMCSELQTTLKPAPSESHCHFLLGYHTFPNSYPRISPVYSHGPEL